MTYSYKTTVRRRSLILGAAAAVLAPAVRAATSVRIMQSTALTGPLGDLGSAMHLGAKAAFAAINAKGGVGGRTIDLVVEDDGYEVPRSVANVKKFLADESCLALFNCMGTPAVTAMLPLVKESGVPFIAPFTGGLVARRADMRNVLNIRASYPDEALKLVHHLATIGITRIGVAYQDNAFGNEVRAGAKTAIDRYQLTDVTSVAVSDAPGSIDAAIQKLMDQNTKALVLGLAGKPLTDFIRAIRARSRGLPLYALSVFSSPATIKTLGQDAVGITVSQVVPLPSTSNVMPLVKDFMRDWADAKAPMDPSHLALEGYVNARVFAEMLRRAGPAATRQSLVQAAWGINDWDLGGYTVNFTKPGTNASTFVELTMLGGNGRFMR